MNSDHLITIAQFTVGVDAHLARIKLESEGIECVIRDENIVEINWHYSNAVGGIRLQVRAADAQRAVEVLNRECEPVEFNDEEIQAVDDSNQCPRCHSGSIVFEGHVRPSIVTSFICCILSLPVKTQKWKCVQCNFKWKKQDSSRP